MNTNELCDCLTCRLGMSHNMMTIDAMEQSGQITAFQADTLAAQILPDYNTLIVAAAIDGGLFANP